MQLAAREVTVGALQREVAALQEALDDLKVKYLVLQHHAHKTAQRFALARLHTSFDSCCALDLSCVQGSFKAGLGMLLPPAPAARAPKALSPPPEAPKAPAPEAKAEAEGAKPGKADGGGLFGFMRGMMGGGKK